MTHNENCDAVGPGPDLGPSTKPCNCGASEKLAMAYQELCGLSINELKSQPCLCVRCGDCEGSGRIFTANPWSEPFDESCEYCDGTGYVEKCDRCSLLDEIEGEAVVVDGSF